MDKQEEFYINHTFVIQKTVFSFSFGYWYIVKFLMAIETEWS